VTEESLCVCVSLSAYVRLVPGSLSYQKLIQSVNQSINQSINQSVNQSISQSVNQIFLRFMGNQKENGGSLECGGSNVGW
jgi:uncharacterized membrane protein YjjB (DUF3815 family)